MAYLRPCFNCAADKASCARRGEINAALSGVGITSVSFKCDQRVSKFRPGQRVEFDWRYYEASDYHSECFFVTFNGTIMREQKGNRRFSIRVDQSGEFYDMEPRDVLNNPEFVSARPADIRPLPEPDRPMCELCSAFIGDPKDILERCYDQHSLAGCRHAQAIAARSGQTEGLDPKGESAVGTTRRKDCPDCPGHHSLMCCRQSRQDTHSPDSRAGGGVNQPAKDN